MRAWFAGIEAFVYTARYRSFRRAAEELGITSAAVSKAVLRLEKELGVELLHRTTRSVALSDQGAVFLVRCEAAMAELHAGQEVLARAQGVPRGELIVSMPFVLGSLLVRSLARFMAHYPALRVHLRFTDRKARLVDDRVDVAIRVGPLKDSSLMSRKLSSTRWTTVASPAYLARMGRPQTVEELRGHTCLCFRSPRGKLVPWTFKSTGTFAVEGALDLDQGEMLIEAAMSGLGVAQVFDLMVKAPLQSGRLQALLPNETTDGPTIYALCLRSQRAAPKVQAFISFLLETFGSSSVAAS